MRTTYSIGIEELKNLVSDKKYESIILFCEDEEDKHFLTVYPVDKKGVFSLNNYIRVPAHKEEQK